MSNSLLGTIKQAALEAVENTKPVALMPGTVLEAEPLRVLVEQRLELPSEFLIMTESLRLRGMAKGDSVLLLRMQGGQKFVILDRM